MIARLCPILLVIIAILWMKRPLFMIISGGFTAALVLCDIPVTDAVVIMDRSMTSRDTITVALNFYLVTFLQRMLGCRGRLKQAEESLNGLFSNRGINASATPAVIGFLPPAGTTNLCTEVVKSSCEDYMSREDMTTVTNFFRHIPECFLPTYSSVLIALAVSGVGAGEFVVAMIPLVAVLFLIGYVFYLRRLPKATGHAPRGGRIESVKMLIRSLWSILFIMVPIAAADIPVYAATPLVTVLSVFVDRLGVEEVRPMFRSAFESITIFNTILIVMFKDIITSAGVTRELSTFSRSLPVPTPLVFTLILFFGSIINGANTTIPLCMLMAMATMPQGGVSLLVLLMSSSYAAMQIGPTHVCLFVAAEYFKVNIGELMERSIPMILLFFVAAPGYTAALGVFQGKKSKKHGKFLNRTFLHVYNDMTCLDT